MNLKDVKPMKTAIVGCGHISDVFFKNFIEKFSIIEVVKCCSKGGESAKAKAAQYGIEASTFEEILADLEIELIINATPTTQHYDIIKRSLEAGKHVFTEKVITPDFRQAQELMELAKEKGLRIGCEPDHFLGASWQCAREYVDKGMLGEVTSIVATTNQNYSSVAERLGFVNEPAGGCGYDFGIYIVTQLVNLLGPAKEVCGIMKTCFPTRVHNEIRHPEFGKEYTYINEDLVSASILFESGATATLMFSGNTLLEVPPIFNIYGTQGVLQMSMAAEFSGDVKLITEGSFVPNTVIPSHGILHDSRGAGAAEMAWSIRLGREHRASVEMGIHCLEIIQGIEISSKTKQYYQLTTTCERPRVLPRGFKGSTAIFSFSDEGALVL